MFPPSAATIIAPAVTYRNAQPAGRPAAAPTPFNRISAARYYRRMRTRGYGFCDTHPLLLGLQALPAVRAGRDAHHLMPGQPEDRRAGNLPGPADHCRRNRGAGPGTTCWRARTWPGTRPKPRPPPWRAAAAPRPPRRATPARQARRVRAMDRVGLRQPQGPARPRTPRRAYPTWSLHPHRPAAARPIRSHLAQLGHWGAREALPHRLRPLTKESISLHCRRLSRWECGLRVRQADQHHQPDNPRDRPVCAQWHVQRRRAGQ